MRSAIFINLTILFVAFTFIHTKHQAIHAAVYQKQSPDKKNFTIYHGAIIRGDSTQRKIALVFTGDEFADGANIIMQTLRREKIKASFFFTGRFYRNIAFKKIIDRLKKDDHYLGSHGNEHLLCCDWKQRDSLLITKQQFTSDLNKGYQQLNRFGILKTKAHFFLPPFEWYNDSIAAWTQDMKLQLINFTPGTLSNADYTTPLDKNYRSSNVIYQSVIDYEQSHPSGLNGFIFLMHVGVDAKRTDKFYQRLPQLIQWLHQKGYQFEKVNDLLK